MNFFLRSIPIVLLLGTATSYAAAPIGTGTVKATTLNVRARATLQREVIAQVKRGSEVTILEAVDGWLRIVPPAGTVAWIPARALNGSTVTTKAIVYAGPGMLFSAIATLKPGDTVKVRSKRSDGWARIAPPAGTAAWVFGQYIDADMPTTPTATATPNTARPTETSTQPAEQPAEPAAALTPKPTENPHIPPLELPDDPENMVLHEIRAEPLTEEIKYVSPPKKMEKNGVIFRVAQKDKLWAYVIATPLHQKYYPVAYLAWEGQDLSQWEHKAVRLSGTQQFVHGWPRPLLRIETLEEQ